MPPNTNISFNSLSFTLLFYLLIVCHPTFGTSFQIPINIQVTIHIGLDILLRCGLGINGIICCTIYIGTHH